MRAVGWLMPNGPSRKEPAWRSSRLPKTLGESKRGTHSQSIDPSGAISMLVWQLDRNAYSAIGGKGDGAAALCRITSSRGFPSARAAGADVPGLVVLMNPPTVHTSRRSGRLGRRRRVEQRLHHPPGLLDAVLAGEAGAVALHGGVQEHLVGGGALAALLGELHVEADLLGGGRVGALGVDQQPDPGGGVEPDDELVGLGAA